jgi:hypothetical protein
MEKITLKHATVTSLPPDASGVRPVHISSQQGGSIQLYGLAAENFTKRYSQEFQSSNSSNKTASTENQGSNSWNDVDCSVDFEIRQLAAGHSGSSSR